jgi:prepilin-type N-terminal cleavage/methylation domain-containing protein
MDRKAFTLYELIVVIAISSIIGVSIFFSEDNDLIIARDQLIQHIRYTQSLALFDDKYRVAPESSSARDINRTRFWYKSMWQVYLATTKGTIYYVVFNDTPTSGGNYDLDPTKSYNEIAIDPQTRKYLYGAWKELSSSHSTTEEEVNTKLNLSLQYSVDDFRFKYLTSGVVVYRYDKINIFFDIFGRPYITETVDGKTLTSFKNSTDPHPFNYLLQETIQIKISKDDDSLCINLEPISGYVYPEKCLF